MAGRVYEWYGYPADDDSPAALDGALHQTCPFVPGPCTKKGGACAVQPGAEPIIVCPKRLYFDGHLFLREIAHDAFSRFDVDLGPDMLPLLVSGDDAWRVAADTGVMQVGVFGAGWSGELRLPEMQGARYSVDFTLTVVDPQGDLRAFVPVEVQSIDTTGSYKPSIEALATGRRIVQSNFGMNWENVNKRILPQLIVKGLMLQAERLCTTGIYFVTPEPVYDRVMARLGGEARLRRIPKQPGSITFVRYQYQGQRFSKGQPLELASMTGQTISTSDMSLAFISPENLPAAGAYEKSIRARLGARRRPTRSV